MHRLKGPEGIEGDAKLLKGLQLVFVFENQPKVTGKVKELRRVIE
jgi:hypothetical protein